MFSILTKIRGGYRRLDSKYVKYVIFILCFIAVMAIQIAYLHPLEQPLIGHDSPYHYLRTEALKKRIEDFDLLNGGVDYLFNNGAGYASYMAYPDILLFIPALLRVCGFSMGTSMSLFLIICSVICYVLMFICARKISESGTCGTIAAVIYSLSQYRIDNMFSRFAMGESLSFIFWPIIIYGLYDMAFDKFKKPYLLGIGIGGMLLTHSISTALSLGLCVVVLLISLKRISTDITLRKFFARLGITALTTALVTAFYWAPLLEFMSSCELTVSHPISIASNYVVEFFNLFRDIPVLYSEAGMGILMFALCLPRIMLCKKSPIRIDMQSEGDNHRHKLIVAMDTFMILGFIICLLATNIAPWKILAPILNFTQFPWRLFAMASTLIAIAAAVYVFIVAKHTNALKTSMIAVTVLTVLFAGAHLKTIDPHYGYPMDDNYYQNSEVTFDVGYGEWLPWEAKTHFDDVKSLSDKLILENGEQVPFERNNGNLSFTVAESENTYADIPYIWYKGYKATDESDHELKTCMNDKGMLRVDISGVKGSIFVEYKLTVIKIISYTVSILTVIILGAILLFKKIRKKAIHQV